MKRTWLALFLMLVSVPALAEPVSGCPSGAGDDPVQQLLGWIQGAVDAHRKEEQAAFDALLQARLRSPEEISHDFLPSLEGLFQGFFAGYVGDDVANGLDPHDRVLPSGQNYQDWLFHGNPAAYWKNYNQAHEAGRAIALVQLAQALYKLGSWAIGRVAIQLGPKTPAELAIWQQVKDVNAVGGDSNCVSVAISTDKTLAGEPAQALKVPGQPLEKVVGLLKQNVCPDCAPIDGLKSLEEAAAKMKSSGIGRAILVIRNAKGGHALNLVLQDGEVVVVDAQNGYVTSIASYARAVGSLTWLQLFPTAP